MRRGDEISEARLRELLNILHHEISGSLTGIAGLLPPIERLMALIPPEATPVAPTRYVPALASAADRLELATLMIQILADASTSGPDGEICTLPELLEAAVERARKLYRALEVRVEAAPDVRLACRRDYLLCGLVQAMRLLGPEAITITCEVQDALILLITLESQTVSFAQEKLALRKVPRGSTLLPLLSSSQQIDKDALWLAMVEKIFRLHGGGIAFGNTAGGCFLKCSMLVGTM